MSQYFFSASDSRFKSIFELFQKEENTNAVENVAKINNENSSGSAKVTIVVNYEAQSNSSQSHAFRKNHAAEPVYV